VQEAPFKIYNASAGSGKTHTLTKAYLKIILNSNKRFKKILAITFTNKAVNEMKTRILTSLFEFGQVEDLTKAPPLFQEILEELDLDIIELRQRSKNVLKEILHNYAFFDISTIDKFTHRIIRTFAKDLKIPQNFEVILDTDLLLDEAVARLVHKAGTDKKITRVLLDFALEKIDDDKSWDVTFDLFKIGKLLFRENHTPHLEKLGNKHIDDFLGLKKILLERSDFFKKKISASAQSALQLIRENGLEFSDFTRSYFPKFMMKIAEGDLNIDFKAGWKQDFANVPLYNKSTSESTKVVLDELHSRFTIIFNSIRDDYYQLLFLKNCYGNIVPLTVLNAIYSEVKALQTERDQLSISEFNTLISKEIKNQPAPFIYERLGEKYRHYFVDEFQDTSALQWNNLVPLISNALESEDMQGKTGSLFLVGDAKQAIYRWRGGRAEQFLNLVGLKSNPFVIPPKIYNLPTNYRSFDEVVRFNNEFFTATSPFLNNVLYNNMFLEGNQQGFTAKKGGLVQLTFLEKNEENDSDELYCTEVLTTIHQLLEKNYGYEEMCILVRGNKQGVLLADYLTRNQVPTISSESLLLNSSDKVRFLVNLLQYIADPQNLETVFEILSFLSDGKPHRNRFIQSNLLELSKLLKNDFNIDVQRLEQLSVYDVLELSIKQLGLVTDSDAYIMYFMDVVLEVEQKEGTAIQTFLNHWEKKKEKLSITAPEKVSAVRIMTIHKAKGLEFPVVIFPFANENIYKRMDKKMWLHLDPTIYNGFDEILVNEKKEVADYSPEAAERYYEEEHRMELDAFNVLYVALTRAEKALYIISEKDLNAKGDHKTDRYSGLFIDYLKTKNLWSKDKQFYTFGSLKQHQSERSQTMQEQIDFLPSGKERSAFKILTKAGMLWDTDREDALSKGNQIHYMLGLIETEKDILPALETLLRSGDIATGDYEALKVKLETVVKHPDLHTYYKEGTIIKAEKDIITRTGQVLRPDRIVLKDDQATIIDYKTGKRNPKYKEQLYAYADALTSMGYRVENKIIVYINENVITEFV